MILSSLERAGSASRKDLFEDEYVVAMFANAEQIVLFKPSEFLGAFAWTRWPAEEAVVYCGDIERLYTFRCEI